MKYIDDPAFFIPAPAKVLLAVLSIQLGAAFAIDLFEALGPAGVVFGRLAISSVIFLLLFRPDAWVEVKDNYKILLAYGLTLSAMNWFFYEAIARVPLGIVVAIEFMGPLAVGVITSKKRSDLLWIAIAVLGLAILTPEIGSNLDLVGVGYAVAAGIGWGGFVILTKKVNSNMPGNSGLACGMLIACFFMLPMATTTVDLSQVDKSLLLNILFVALLSTTVPFYLEFAALKKLTPTTYGILITLEPCVAALVGTMMLGDQLSFASIFAIACVTSAAVGATLTQTREA